MIDIQNTDEQKAFIILLTENTRGIRRQLKRLDRIEEELLFEVSTHRKKELKLATELIAKELERYSYPSEEKILYKVRDKHDEIKDKQVAISKAVEELRKYIRKVEREHKYLKKIIRDII